MWYAVASGALASGVGYAIWYTALPALKATTAATVQLSVPVIAALGGIVFLGESITLRLALASVAILGGIALVVLRGGMPMALGTSGQAASCRGTADHDRSLAGPANVRSGTVAVSLGAVRHFSEERWPRGGHTIVADRITNVGGSDGSGSASALARGGRRGQRRRRRLDRLSAML